MEFRMFVILLITFLSITLREKNIEFKKLNELNIYLRW